MRLLQLAIRSHQCLLSLGLLLLGACATKYRVSTYPSGAKIKIENIVSREVFEVGEGPITFEHDERYGEGFIVIAEKDLFLPKRIYVTQIPGAETSYQINLEPKKSTLEGAKGDQAKDDKKDDKDKDKDKPPQQPGDDTDKRLAVLERTFEIYKDALFSQRYGTGPASYDRDRVDTSVALVSKTQQLMEKKKYNDAMKVIDKLIERDEYLAQGHILKGSVHYLKQEIPEAIVSWERALEINPSDRLTRQYLISAYRKAGKQLPDNVDDLEMVDRIPAGAASPLQTDPLKLRLRSR